MEEKKKSYLKFDFTIGPVQGFVAQSRRMKDLLNSSFLLSYLAGQAMNYVLEKGGTINFPSVENMCGEYTSLIKDIIEFHNNHGKPLTRKGTWLGSLPNRFQATVPVPKVESEGFNPEECVQAVKNAWKRIADAVWDEFVSPVVSKLNNHQTEEIWRRQVENFWEIQWVLQEIDDENTDAQTIRYLDFRKFWRDHVPSIEPGDKCQLIPHLQELSGFERHTKDGRKQQEKFWSELREHVGAMDLGEKERLCAIALIKRLVSSKRVCAKAIGWEFDEKARYFPSFPYVAAYPWIKEAVATQKEKASEFAQVAKKYKLSLSERLYPERFQIKKDDNRLLKDFIRLEGPAFFARWELDKKKEQNATIDDTELKEKYDELVKAMGEQPSPYFGLLLMDGDQLGKLLQTNSCWVSQSLNIFTMRLQKVIQEHEGVPVYAGGDDVLAIFPLYQVLSAAVRIRQLYIESFEKMKLDLEKKCKIDTSCYPKPTISAAVLFAHAYTPIKNVLRYAHVLLDDVAKAQNGRDSIAVSIWRHSGPDWSWVSKWDDSIVEKENVLKLELLAKQWQMKSDQEELFLSSSFLHKWLEFFDKSFSAQDDSTHFINSPEWKEVAIDLMAADFLRIVNHEKESLTKEEAKKMVDDLFQVCLVSNQFQPDGIMLVRFLKQKGVGKNDR